MTLSEIIQDIHGLEAELAQLEKRYGLLSADFYHLYKAGELEQSRDFIQWVGYYEAKLKREACYREMMYTYLRDLRQHVGLGALRLTPQTASTGA
jgi:D-alanyl-D-alanine dipeptidase